MIGNNRLDPSRKNKIKIIKFIIIKKTPTKQNKN